MSWNASMTHSLANTEDRRLRRGKHGRWMHVVAARVIAALRSAHPLNVKLLDTAAGWDLQKGNVVLYVKVVLEKMENCTQMGRHGH
jgi:hypothetical protein